MATLGFRPPQFSEDGAWLPTWLQQHQEEPPERPGNESQTLCEQPFMDLSILKGNIIEGQGAYSLSKEDGRYGNYPLFLSSDENTSSSILPSKEVLHLHLHLSSIGNSETVSNSVLATDKAKMPKHNGVLSNQQIETSASSGEKVNKYSPEYNVSGVSLQDRTPKLEQIRGFYPFTGNEDAGKPCGEKFSDLDTEGDDIDYAVELSIAASEALVIHEMVREVPSFSKLQPSAVLEAALLVKQKRLNGSKDAFHHLNEQIEEVDFLSDLDDDTMRAAYEDIGLSITDADDLVVDDSLVSEIERISVFENHVAVDSQAKELVVGVKEAELTDVTMLDCSVNITKSKNLPLESVNAERSRMLSDSQTLVLSSCPACHVDPSLPLPLQPGLDDVPSKQEIDLSDVEITSLVHQEIVMPSPQVQNSENAEREHETNKLVLERFKSRWLGGWTGKELDGPGRIKQSNGYNIHKLFLCETSFLSESANTPADENSYVQEQAKRAWQASQSSIPNDVSSHAENESILKSQDHIRSSPSFVDPLCSVVPCSISSEGASSTLLRNQPLEVVNTEKSLCPVLEQEMGSFPRGSSLKVEFNNEEEQAAPMINSDGPRLTCCRKFTALEAYSVLLPSSNGISRTESIYCNQSLPCNSSLLISKAKTDPFGKSSRGNSSRFLLSSSIPESNNGNDHQNNDDISFVRDSLSQAGSELQLHHQDARDSTYISNFMSHCNEAPKALASKAPRAEIPQEAETPGNRVEFHHCKVFHNLPSECKNFHETIVPGRKRVRFEETVITVPQKKNISNVQSRHTCRLKRGGNRSKSYHPSPDSRNEEMRRLLSNCCIKDTKRMIFQGMEFLLTGISSKKEKELEGIIRNHGGIVRFDVPTNFRGKRNLKSQYQPIPVVLCPKKVSWLTDSIAGGSVLPPQKYMILPNSSDGKCKRFNKLVCWNKSAYIFEKVGHGGGLVLKTLQRLSESIETKRIFLGAIVTEDESKVSRHLKHCASEQNIPVVVLPVSTIKQSQSSTSAKTRKPEVP
ncbi:hypothetical protein RJ641_005035, partial [Dillenia turbinata]